MYKLLLVDDEAIIREGIRTMVDWEALDIVLTASCANAFAALDSMTDDMPDILMTDVRMPGMDGLETLRHMKKIAPKLPVLLLTGHASLGVAVQGMDLGAYDYMLKPVAINELIIKMEEAVRAAA